MIKKIVLTGGPCAGKTTALSKIEQYLTSIGYKVFIVGESATELIKGGIKPFGNQSINMIEFQKLIMLYQIEKEEIYNQATKYYPNDNIVIIYDRGILDNKAYITEQEFIEVTKYLSKKLGYTITEENLLERYDMIIHLITEADRAEEYYTKANNNARTETIEEAIKLDRKTMKSWLGHSNLKIIDNSSNFNDKLDKVLMQIYKILNNPIKTRKQLKYQVELEEDSLNQIKENSIIIDIEQIYLKNNKYEERIRKTKQKNGITNYYYTKQKKKEYGESEIILNKKITKEEYILIGNTCQISDIIIKRRYVFIDNKQYYRLDEYKDNYILEIELTDECEEIKIPEQIHVKKELVKQKSKKL